MKFKGGNSTTNLTEGTKVSIGLHILTIKTIRWARKANDDMLTNDNGEMAVDIAFLDSCNQSLIHRFWLTDNAMWVMDNLRKAIGVYVENKQTQASEMEGKKCLVIVAGEFHFEEDGTLTRNADGTLFIVKKLVPKFYPVNYQFNFIGNPVENNGIPSGDFLVNKGVDLREFFTDADRAWMLMQCDNAPVIEPEILESASLNKMYDDF